MILAQNMLFLLRRSFRLVVIFVVFFFFSFPELRRVILTPDRPAAVPDVSSDCTWADY